jgi:NAD-dependent deacetylase
VSGPVAGELLRRAAAARRVVVFTGAGVSQESGLGTFRDPDGIWSRFRPEELATPEAFRRDPDRVAAWYLERLRQALAARPNAAHRTIASWQRRFPSLVVVTQNVDRLHQRAGSREVLELHGTLALWRCASCGAEADAERLPAAAPALCGCGGRLRPGVVWFGEELPAETFERAAEASRRAELFVAVGTSASVWPAAGLIELAAGAGALVVEVNPEPTPLSHLAEVVLRGRAGEVLPRWAEELEAWRSPA